MAVSDLIKALTSINANRRFQLVDWFMSVIDHARERQGEAFTPSDVGVPREFLDWLVDLGALKRVGDDKYQLAVSLSELGVDERVSAVVDALRRGCGLYVESKKDGSYRQVDLVVKCADNEYVTVHKICNFRTYPCELVIEELIRLGVIDVIYAVELEAKALKYLKSNYSASAALGFSKSLR